MIDVCELLPCRSRQPEVPATPQALRGPPRASAALPLGGSGSDWLRSRLRSRALHAYQRQRILQIKEETAAVEARRPAVIVARPDLHLDLPEALQQQPSRLVMCSKCAKWIEQMELAEQSCVVQAQVLREAFEKCGMQAAPAATASAQEAATAATAAAARPAEEEAQHRQPPGQPHCGGCSHDGATEGSPSTPKQPPVPQQQQQRSSSDQEQEQQRASSTSLDRE